MSKQHFNIVVPAYNAHPWIEKCLRSIAEQTYRNYDILVIDDASTDGLTKELIHKFSVDQGWQTTFNSVNRGGLANLVSGIDQLSCDNEDVIILIDGDDWLYNDSVLGRLASIYETESPLITYGQYLNLFERTAGVCRPLNWWEMSRRSFRKIPWIFSHLRTFKYKLWKEIQKEDLRDQTGNYFLSAWDHAIMYPMIEMAAPRIRFIPEILYVYNNRNPINVHKVNESLETRNANTIRKLPRYPRLF